MTLTTLSFIHVYYVHALCMAKCMYTLYIIIMVYNVMYHQRVVECFRGNLCMQHFRYIIHIVHYLDAKDTQNPLTYYMCYIASSPVMTMAGCPLHILLSSCSEPRTRVHSPVYYVCVCSPAIHVCPLKYDVFSNAPHYFCAFR